MVSCISCGLSHSSARKVGITFHRFPKKSELRPVWIQFVNCSEESLPKFAVLCSQHFQESDFEKSAFKVILKHGAVPSIFVQRRKYDKFKEASQKASLEGFAAVSSSHVGSTSSAAMNINNEPQHSSERTRQASQQSIGDNSPLNVKLRQQIIKLSSMNLMKSQKIRQLQKQTWFLKKRIIKLSSVIKELKIKNVLNAE